ncbi:MAG: hypothetical protein RL375_3986 [Pseudomonadota bacterium]
MKRQRGVSYLMLLLTMALSGIVLAGAATVWSHAQRRERETQLLWVGGQIRQAITAYARMASLSDAGTPGGAPVAGDHRYPARLEDLLLDDRSLTPRRYLRQVYVDPITRSTDWGLIRNEAGRIVGVYSRSEDTPIKTGHFATADADFEGARRYADWRFSAVATPGLRRLPPAARSASGADTQADESGLGGDAGQSTLRPRPSPLRPVPATPGLLQPWPGARPGPVETAASAPPPPAPPSDTEGEGNSAEPDPAPATDPVDDTTDG